MEFAHASNHRFTEARKALQLQVVTDATDDGDAEAVGWADAFGSWCMVAIPLRPEVDGEGNLVAACELATVDVSDQRTIVGMRDVRVSKYTQDLKPGECTFVNGYGSRLMLGEKVVALNHGGGFLAFDRDKKVASLVGIPSAPGEAAPYLSISTDAIGLVSATGAASIAVQAAGVTVSGSTVAIDAGRVDLGKGAVDPVVTYSQLMQLVAILQTWAAAIAGSPAGVPAPPMVIPPGRRVFAPKG